MPPNLRPAQLAFLAAEARQVLALCDKELSLDDIKCDLLHTGNVQRTLDRIANGLFLSGTERDPAPRKKMPISLSDKLSPVSSRREPPQSLQRSGPVRKPGGEPGKRPGDRLSKRRMPTKVISLDSEEDEDPPLKPISIPSLPKLAAIAGNSINRTFSSTTKNKSSLLPEKSKAPALEDDTQLFRPIPSPMPTRRFKNEPRDSPPPSRLDGPSLDRSKPMRKIVVLELSDEDEDPNLIPSKKRKPLPASPSPAPPAPSARPRRRCLTPTPGWRVTSPDYTTEEELPHPKKKRTSPSRPGPPRRLYLSRDKATRRPCVSPSPGWEIATSDCYYSTGEDTPPPQVFPESPVRPSAAPRRRNPPKRPLKVNSEDEEPVLPMHPYRRVSPHIPGAPRRRYLSKNKAKRVPCVEPSPGWEAVSSDCYYSTSDGESKPPAEPTGSKNEAPAANRTFISISDSDDDLPPDINPSQLLDGCWVPTIKRREPVLNEDGLSADTLALLMEIKRNQTPSSSDPDSDGHEKAKRRQSASGGTAAKRRRTGESFETDQAVLSRSRLSEAEKTRRATAKATEDAKKAAARAAKTAERAAKEAENEARKAAKEAAKEAARREKQRAADLASMNRLPSRETSAAEMVVDISRGLGKTQLGKSAAHFLTHWKCEVSDSWRPAASGPEAEWKIVKWRRKTKAEYDTEQRLWVPLPRMEIRDERHVLVHLSAKEFVELAFPEDGEVDLDNHVHRMQHLVHEDVKLLYMIEGLAQYVRKCKNQESLRYQDLVRATMNGSAAPARKKAVEKAVDDDAVEDALLQLQMIHKCLIHQTETEAESAEWISIFTGDISTIPYKHVQHTLEAAYCTDLGQVKTGADAANTYLLMLQQIHKLTEPVAAAIVAEYPSLPSLIAGFRSAGPEMLQDLHPLMRKDGAATDRRIGPQMSRRVYAVFFGLDPKSTDV